MTITFGTPTTDMTTSEDGGNGGNEITLTKPGDLANGDGLLVLVVRKGASSTVITNDWGAGSFGFTDVVDNDGVTIQQHYRAWLLPVPNAAAAPASWLISVVGGGGGSPQAIAGTAIAVHGIDLADLIDSFGSESVSAGATMTFSGLTTASGDAVYVGFGQQQRNATHTAVSPLTELVDVPSDHSTAGNNASLYAGFLAQAVPGSVGAQSATSTVNAGANLTNSFALRAFSAGALNADAGPDQAVVPGQLVNLDGSGSIGATGFEWTQIAGTPDVTNYLAGAATVNASFYAPQGPATLTFQLTVTDGIAFDSDTVVITIAAGGGLPPPITIQVREGGAWV